MLRIFLLLLCCVSRACFAGIPYPDFRESNFLKGFDERFDRYKTAYQNLDPLFVDLFEGIYLRNIREAEVEIFTGKGRIPKIVHQIWLGGELPEFYKIWISTWTSLTGWTYKLWTDEEVKKFSMHNRDLFDKTTNLGEKSDILRLEVLYQYGGVYVDTDLECARPDFLEELHQKFDFYIAVEPLFHGIVQEYKTFKFCNAIIGSARHHPLLNELIVNLKANWLAYHKQNVFQRTGPHYLTRIIHQYEMRGAHKQRNMYLPCSFFYPFSYCDRKVYVNCPEKVIDFFPETIGIHYWMTSWGASSKKPFYRKNS